MLDHSNRSSVAPTEPTEPARSAQSRSARQRRSSGVGLAVVVGAALTGCVGGATGVHRPGLLLAGVVAALIGIVVIGAILVVGFIGVITMLAAEGRRRARSVEDVRLLIAGTAGAYGALFARFVALVRGTSPPPPGDEEPDLYPRPPTRR